MLTVLFTDNLPELGSYLVSTLATLHMYNLSHLDLVRIRMMMMKKVPLLIVANSKTRNKGNQKNIYTQVDQSIFECC